MFCECGCGLVTPIAIPVGLVIDHLCGNRRCVNPSHVEPVTQQEHIRRSARCRAVGVV
jgi:hypothetical protein